MHTVMSLSAITFSVFPESWAALSPFGQIQPNSGKMGFSRTPTNL